MGEENFLYTHMARKTYPWKTRYAPLSHRGRKENRRRRFLAAEERLARYVYDEMTVLSPHPHIAAPCHGLDPEKVRRGAAGSASYRLTARALLYNSPLQAYLEDDGLMIKKEGELVPLLRKCTDPKDGHIDWPKLVRHIVGLYYITHIDPQWLFDQIPVTSQSEAQRVSSHYLPDIIGYYLFRRQGYRPYPITCKPSGVSYIPPIRPDFTPDDLIFQTVERKLRHIIQNQKDDGDRARWMPYAGNWKPGERANHQNLLRLYGGDVYNKLAVEALNDLRDKGILNQENLNPGKLNIQHTRRQKLRALELDSEQAYAEVERFEGLIEKCEREIDELRSEGSKEGIQKLEKKLAGLEGALQSRKRKLRKAERLVKAKKREIENGRIRYFHALRKVEENNRSEVKKYVAQYLRWQRASVNLDFENIIQRNYDAGCKGECLPCALNVADFQYLPNKDIKLYSVYLLGAVFAGRKNIELYDETISISEFATRYHDNIRIELAAHGLVRNIVFQRLKAQHEKYNGIVDKLRQRLKELGVIDSDLLSQLPKGLHTIYLELVGVASLDCITKMGKDYFEQSRLLHKMLGELQVLSPDEIEQVRAAYRSKARSLSGSVHRMQALDLDPACFTMSCA